MLEQLDATPESIPAEFEAEASASSESPSPLDIPGDWDPVHDPGVSVARDRHGDVAALVVVSRDMSAETPIDFGVAGWTDPTFSLEACSIRRTATRAESRLRYYASRYPMVEVDATYYSLPSRSTAAAWDARTPPDFTFDIKAHALMTGHPTDVRRLPDWVRRALPPGRMRRRASTRATFQPRSSTKCGRDSGRRSSQSGPRASSARSCCNSRDGSSRRARAANALRRAKELLGDDCATVEFRNRAWMEGRIAARTIALLTELQLSYVIVDAPPGMQSSMPPTVAVTDPRLAVFRLHGRRVATWEAKNDPVTERYRYLYDREQLRAWLPDVFRDGVQRCARAYDVQQQPRELRDDERGGDGGDRQLLSS